MCNRLISAVEGLDSAATIVCMGLDAIVYRHKANLPFDPDSVGAVLDESTGEYYFPDPVLESAREREFPRETRPR